MKRYASSRTGAGASRRQSPDFLERTRRARGGSSRSYTEGVHSPPRVNEDSKNLIVLVILTIALPPLGIALIWRRGSFDLPLQIGATALAFVLMVIYFSQMIPEDKPAAYQPPIQRPSAVTEYAIPQTDTYSSDGDAAALY